MSDFLQSIIPIPQPDFAEEFEVYQATYEFYREVEERQDLETYCEWYYQVSQEHQQDFAKMQDELNIMSWFYRGKR
jgi:hypothetical protein